MCQLWTYPCAQIHLLIFQLSQKFTFGAQDLRSKDRRSDRGSGIPHAVAGDAGHPQPRQHLLHVIGVKEPSIPSDFGSSQPPLMSTPPPPPADLACAPGATRPHARNHLTCERPVARESAREIDSERGLGRMRESEQERASPEQDLSHCVAAQYRCECLDLRLSGCSSQPKTSQPKVLR